MNTSTACLGVGIDQQVIVRVEQEPQGKEMNDPVPVAHGDAGAGRWAAPGGGRGLIEV
jgi:hypothetical protein